ncbi:MAG: extracellular solute-binding protein [Chloroflexota bacterium]
MRRLFIFTVVGVMLFGAIGASISQAQTASQKPITLWTKYNDQNPDPKAPATDKWIVAALKDYKTTTGNDAKNVVQPFDQINAKLNIAVQAKGDVPDLSYVDSQQLGFFTQNGTLTDLTEYVKGAPWFDDVDPKALAACTGLDGKIYCVPTGIQNHFVYYWKALYPNGFPATTDALLAAAKDLKAKNKFALTFKGAEASSVERVYYGLILSYGGTIANEKGEATWANDKTLEVVKFVRAMFAGDYSPKVSLAPGFDNEEPFKSGDAAAFIAGSYSYVYLTPLTAPDGTKYEQQPPDSGFDKDAIAVGAAAKDGKLDFAPPLAAPGGKPTSLILATAYGIPVGAKNVDGAEAFIDYQMQTAQQVSYAGAAGALPSALSAAKDPTFSSPYWQAVAKYVKEDGVPGPTLKDYDKGLKLLSDAMVKLATDPNLDPMATLKAAQDEYNAGLQ